MTNLAIAVETTLIKTEVGEFSTICKRFSETIIAKGRARR
jgi:hypothetical protein